MSALKQYANKHFEKIKKVRRAIHQYPETAYEEYKTSELIRKNLTELGIPYTNINETGVVGLIEGNEAGKTILLRADMDALNVQEEADVEYKSLVDNKMHACGHDGHVASVLGAAMILNEMKSELQGNVKLMFQPSEEASPSGAKMMIDNGVLENPRVDAAVALHVWGPLEEGLVEMKYSEMMASFTGFDIKIKGKGTHAAMPNLGIDPIVISGQVINNLQTICSRTIDPIKPLVLSITEIKGGDSYNVIPEDVSMKGSIRTFDDNVTDLIIEQMHQIIDATTKQYNATYELVVDKDIPPLINDSEITKLSKQSIGEIIGQDKISMMEHPTMVSEDFAYIASEVPSTFFFVGIAKEDKEAVHHHPKFAWDDKVLIDSSAMLAQIAYDYLAQSNR